MEVSTTNFAKIFANTDQQGHLPSAGVETAPGPLQLLLTTNTPEESSGWTARHSEPQGSCGAGA